MEKYIEKYKNKILAVMFIVFLIHLPRLNSVIIGIDTENIIRERRKFYRGWLDIGRQGLVSLKILLGGYDLYSPFFTGLMTVLLLTASIIAFLYLWNRLTENWMNAGKMQNTLCWGIAAAAWASHPVLAEQLYFSLQSAEVCLAIFLTAIALICICNWQKSRKKYWIILSVGILLITFSTYQSFVELFIFGAVSVVLVEYIDLLVNSEKQSKFKELVMLIMPFLLVFMAAFVINTLITNALFKDSTYLKEQIMWGSAPTADIVVSILKQIAKTYTGIGSLHYDWTFGLITIVTLTVIALYILKKSVRAKTNIVISVFLLISLMVTPYLIIIVCGGNAAVRSQLVIPALIGFYAYIGLKICFCVIREINTADKRYFYVLTKSAAVIMGVVCLLTAYRQCIVTETLYYTEKMCYEQDVAIARELINKIDRERGHNWYPVVVIGTYSFKKNNSCIVGETIGRSFFEHDAEAEPRFYWSTRRVLGLMHVLGYNYEQVTEPEMIAIAMEDSKYMPEWPQEGCVQVHDDMIIVKMSNFEED